MTHSRNAIPWKMYRDVWVLGPPSNGYPGGFPRGFVSRVKRRWWGAKRLWMCSGGFHDGVTVDLKREVRPSIIGNCEQLPIRSNQFDLVVLDPPYSEEEAKQLYDVAYPNPFRLLKEAWRVTRAGGHIVFLHRLVPGTMKGLEMKSQHAVAIVGVCRVGAWSNMRALVVWRKPESLDAWDPSALGKISNSEVESSSPSSKSVSDSE